ncbi:MAG: B12-binding domain-containing radical SAM protein [Lachnospiraceae bacterium]|nr:B12-binding domain-containing radical SAM protein [Lachnospiraceae bacterium]
MKKVLLVAINAKYIHSNLAVHSLRASAGESKDAVFIAEYTINQQKDEILRDIFLNGPEVLCFSCYLWNLEYVEAVSKEFHKLCPDVPIWLGGPEVSYETKTFLEEHAYLTGVMIGEGEDTFRELCEYYLKAEWRNADKPRTEADASLLTIKGIAFRELDKIHFTAPREPKSLSDVPFCYEDLKEYENRIIYYESSRGCPFSCSYCLSSIDKKLRFRDLGLVRKELEFFLEKKVPQVKFVDRTFNCDREHAREILRYVTEHDNGITNFHFEISADLLEEEDLRLMEKMRPGLIQLEIGVQTTNEATIHEIHRSMKLERVKAAVSRIRSLGNIHQHLDLIAGLPYEGLQSFRHSFDEILSLWPNQLQLGFLKVLKGSYMYEHADEYEIAYHDAPPYEVLRTKWLSYEEILQIKKVEEMLEAYYNSGQFEVTMKLLNAMTDSMFALLMELGWFYEQKGYFGMSHSRLHRCEILLEFLKERKEGNEPSDLAAFEEALTFDLYYRENCKTRPSWAPDQSQYKEMTKRLCKKGKLNHLEPVHYHFPEKSERGLNKLPERLPEPLWALFDYEERDPLDHQAKVIFYNFNEMT